MTDNPYKSPESVRVEESPDAREDEPKRSLKEPSPAARNRVALWMPGLLLLGFAAYIYPANPLVLGYPLGWFIVVPLVIFVFRENYWIVGVATFAVCWFFPARVTVWLLIFVLAWFGFGTFGLLFSGEFDKAFHMKRKQRYD